MTEDAIKGAIRAAEVVHAFEAEYGRGTPSLLDALLEESQHAFAVSMAGLDQHITDEWHGRARIYDAALRRTLDERADCIQA